MDSMQPYFAGRMLYGDNFTPEQIRAWFLDEEEGYANLGAKEAATYAYGYHALNRQHAFRFVANRRFKSLLGFGSAYGEELKPIIDRVESVTVVDPSAAFVRPDLFGVPATYIKPSADGKLPLASGVFDLATCFGVLHHIPNVSAVMAELSRVMAGDGQLLLREPIISMGDWRNPRRGLTKRERGIPLDLLKSIAVASGFEIVNVSVCMFPATTRLFHWMRAPLYNSGFATWVDQCLSVAFSWNINYHPMTALQRLRPTSAFLVLRKK